MKFIDEVSITIKAGNGGNGIVSFLREKFAAKGGPDGGDGGLGGSVSFCTATGLNTLVNFRGTKVYKAEHGQDGQGQQCRGKAGENLIIKIPVGTIIREKNSGEILHDFTKINEQVLFAKGGIGGHGNDYYKSSIKQAPSHAQDGLPGQELELTLELKLIADVGIIGFPNAGKSTLISCLSEARPKIADYPFTTLVPNLGVVKQRDKSFVMADIPGLIEKASEGKGLGHQFLKHVERTKVLIHLVDATESEDPFDLFSKYITIREELIKYSEKVSLLPEMVCLSKIDSIVPEQIENIVAFFEEQLDKSVLPLSSVSGKNLGTLKDIILKGLNNHE